MILKKVLILILLTSLLLIIVSSCASTPVKVTPAEGLDGFEAGVDKIRIDLNIPGMSACMVKDEEIVWSRGFGYADIEKQIPVTEDTSFHIASLTKTFAAMIAMQLEEEGKLDLQTPVNEFGINLDNVRIVHFLTHTSHSEPPGADYEYCGNCFGRMDKIIRHVSGATFAELLVDRIIKPLELEHTAPNPARNSAFGLTGYDKSSFLKNMAIAYENHGIGTVRRTKRQTYFGTAAGLVSSVSDLGRYAIALDKKEFLQPQTWERIFTPATSVTTGKMLPHGIGWFVQDYEGILLHWHYGQWKYGWAALMIRVPDKGLTFIALANNWTLSSAFPLYKGDVSKSELARLFLDYYVTGDEPLP